MEYSPSNVQSEKILSIPSKISPFQATNLFARTLLENTKSGLNREFPADSALTA